MKQKINQAAFEKDPRKWKFCERELYSDLRISHNFMVNGDPTDFINRMKEPLGYETVPVTLRSKAELIGEMVVFMHEGRPVSDRKNPWWLELVKENPEKKYLLLIDVKDADVNTICALKSYLENKRKNVFYGLMFHDADSSKISAVYNRLSGLISVVEWEQTDDMKKESNTPKNSKMAYSRTADLKRAFNDFWQKALKSSKDFYADMNLEDWIGLKKALGNINNIVTLVVTQRFIEYLHHEGIINDAQRKDMEEQVDSTSANANGYDVEYDSGSIKIVAEVKCNIPVKAGSFGSAQEKNIIKDIEKLSNGKKANPNYRQLTWKTITNSWFCLIAMMSEPVWVRSSYRNCIKPVIKWKSIRGNRSERIPCM